MSKYKRGTQAMLDAAKNDATLLPFDTVFITNYIKGISDDDDMPSGIEVVREETCADNSSSVALYSQTLKDYWYCNSVDLLPAKKQKKAKRIPWQNGTQEDLDNAKDDARLIPKKTYFISKYGATKGMAVYRIDNCMNDVSSIMMFSDTLRDADFHTVEDLEPIKEE